MYIHTYSLHILYFIVLIYSNSFTIHPHTKNPTLPLFSDCLFATRLHKPFVTFNIYSSFLDSQDSLPVPSKFCFCNNSSTSFFLQSLHYPEKIMKPLSISFPFCFPLMPSTCLLTAILTIYTHRFHPHPPLANQTHRFHPFPLATPVSY